MDDLEEGVDDHENENSVVHSNHNIVLAHPEVKPIVGLGDYEVHVHDAQDEEKVAPESTRLDLVAQAEEFRVVYGQLIAYLCQGHFALVGNSAHPSGASWPWRTARSKSFFRRCPAFIEEYRSRSGSHRRSLDCSFRVIQ